MDRDGTERKLAAILSADVFRRLGLTLRHQGRVADDVGEHDGGESALGGRGRHGRSVLPRDYEERPD